MPDPRRDALQEILTMAREAGLSGNEIAERLRKRGVPVTEITIGPPEIEKPPGVEFGTADIELDEGDPARGIKVRPLRPEPETKNGITVRPLRPEPIPRYIRRPSSSPAETVENTLRERGVGDRAVYEALEKLRSSVRRR